MEELQKTVQRCWCVWCPSSRGAIHLWPEMGSLAAGIPQHKEQGAMAAIRRGGGGTGAAAAEEKEGEGECEKQCRRRIAFVLLVVVLLLVILVILLPVGVRLQIQMQDHSVPLQEGRKAVRTCMPRTEKEVRESLWLRHLNPFQPRDYRYRQCKCFKNYTNPPSSHAHARSCPHSNFHLVCCVPSFSDCPCALLPASSLWLFVFLVLGCCSFVVRSPRTPQRRERILFTSY